METLSIMERKTELNSILHLVQALSAESGAPLDTLLTEVARPDSIILLMKDEVKVIGYGCGYFINYEEVYLCQYYRLPEFRGKNRQIGVAEEFAFYENFIKPLGCKRMYGYAVPGLKFVEKAGLKVIRHVVTKELTKEE